MEIEIRNLSADIVDKLSVADYIAEAPRKDYVVWEVIRAWHASQRRGTHAVKGRSEVSGGGRKPWRQKGTGRARQGSIRSPLWTKGGIVHGPKPRNYAYPIPKKKKKLAWRIVLSDRIRAGRVVVVDVLTVSEPRTKIGVELLRRFNLQPGSDKILCIDIEPERNVTLALRNILHTDTVSFRNLRLYDMLYYDTLVFTRKAFESFQRMCEP